MYKLNLYMPNPKKNRTTEIRIRCTEEVKEEITKKIVACGYPYHRGKEVLANFASFLEILNTKDEEWFKKNFSEVDN